MGFEREMAAEQCRAMSAARLPGEDGTCRRTKHGEVKQNNKVEMDRANSRSLHRLRPPAAIRKPPANPRVVAPGSPMLISSIGEQKQIDGKAMSHQGPCRCRCCSPQAASKGCNGGQAALV